MKIKKTRTIEEEVEVYIKFPFFRRQKNTYYAIYSPINGVSIENLGFLNKYRVETISTPIIDYYISNDESNLEMGYEVISENEFDSIKQEFLDRL